MITDAILKVVPVSRWWIDRLCVDGDLEKLLGSEMSNAIHPTLERELKRQRSHVMVPRSPRYSDRWMNLKAA